MAHTVTLITHPNWLGPEEPLGYRFAVHVTPADDPSPIDPADQIGRASCRERV